jgi:uncharacterized membrane protein YhaH (DUF805 family)
MKWILLALSRYFDFKGRSRRREYWMFVLLVLVAILLAGIAMIITKGSFRTQADLARTSTSWAGVVMAPLIVPLIAVTVRRLHDLGLSGWWLVALPIGAAIPAVDALVPFAHLIVMALPSKKEANRFGENPKVRTEG